MQAHQTIAYPKLGVLKSMMSKNRPEENQEQCDRDVKRIYKAPDLIDLGLPSHLIRDFKISNLLFATETGLHANLCYVAHIIPASQLY